MSNDDDHHDRTRKPKHADLWQAKPTATASRDPYGDVGKTSTLDHLVNPNVSVREPTAVQRWRARQNAGAESGVQPTEQRGSASAGPEHANRRSWLVADAVPGQPLSNPNVPVREPTGVQRWRARNAAASEAVAKSEATEAPANATHAAAAEGKATPAGPLPHADRIQASFGTEHDLSNVRAHIDSGSTAAMGAEAYASGTDVVFSKQPDLRVAAHEAAHVVQQQRGVQLYGGVGQDGDAHERNADEVAERVVAGKPAGDLLAASGGPAPEHAAVQRKSAQTQPASKAQPDANTSSTQGPEATETSTADGDDHAMAQAIITGYRAAQHALDKFGTPDAVRPHLLHVGNVSPEYRGKADHRTVVAAADAFDLALRARMQSSPGKFQELDETNKRIRIDLRLKDASGPVQDLSGGSDASYAKEAIAPAFDALAVHTRGALRALDELDGDHQAGRMRIIEVVAGDIDFTCDYVRGLVSQVAREQRRGFAGSADGAANAILKVKHWVREQPGSAHLMAKLLRGVETFDEVAVEIGAPKIGDRDEVPLTESQQSHADEEKAAFEKAMGELTHEIDAVAELNRDKIASFRETAMLDDQPQPDFESRLLRAIVDTMLSTVIGQFAKVLATPGSPVHLPVAAKTVGLPQPPAQSAGFGLDSVFSIGLGSVKTAVMAAIAAPPSQGVDPRKLAAIHFTDALLAAEVARAQAYKDKLGALKNDRAITASQLRDLKSIMRTHASALAEHQRQEITKAWATYLAQSHLGTKHSGGKKVANMHDYFGKHTPSGRVFGTSKAGGDGIVSVVMHIENGAAKPTVDPSATKVIGLNSVLQSDILDAANHELAHVELPKEVHVYSEFAHATIALDERNHVCDVINWDQMLRHVGGLSAFRFWQLWGKNLKV